MQNVKVSIIVPVYNAEKSLEACIRNICRQSYQDLELLLINDGSTDRSEDICREYAKKDKRIKVFSQKNSGVSAARNRGLKEADGELILFHDADDILLMGALAYLTDKIEQTKADVIIFGWRESNGRCVLPGEPGKIVVGEAIRQILSDNEACGGGYPWNKIWRTSAIRKNDKFLPFAENIFAYEDKLWIIENLKQVKNIYLDAYVWYEYRYHADSLSHNISNRVYKSGTKAYYHMAKTLQNYSPELYRYAKEEYYSRIVTDIIVSYRNHNTELLEWMEERFRKHKGEIYGASRLGIKFKVKTFLIAFYLNTFKRKFCIGYLLQNYPEQRCIINKIQSKDYRYEFQVKKFSKYSLFFQICQKLHLYQSKYVFAIYDPLLGTHADFLHAFNTVCDGKKPWCASFETILPRTDGLLKYESIDKPIKRIDCFSKKALYFIQQKKCRAILPLSECAKKLEICLINNLPIENKQNILDKIKVLHPPQELYYDAGQIEKKYEVLPEIPEFLFVGRAFFRKGGKHLYQVLENMQKKYSFHLTVVSDLEADDYITHTSLKEAEQWRKKLKLTNWITYYERLENNKVIELCQKAHVGFLPTLADTYGFSLLEMQACGCPVVSTDVNALPEINNIETGWICTLPKNKFGDILYKTKEEKRIADHMLEVELERNIIQVLEYKDSWKQKALAGMIRIQKDHDPNKYADNLKEIYRN